MARKSQMEHINMACGYAATIGFFDGVHRGHQYLLEQLLNDASSSGMQPMVITFNRHPREIVCPGWQPRLLTSLEHKKQLLREMGIEQLVVLPFDERMASLSARDFMHDELRERLGVRRLLMGYDNRFGHREKENCEGFDDYVRYGRELGIDVQCGQPLIYRGQSVCSSLIRRQLCEGRVGEAADCLGRMYELGGLVVHGEQMGRQIGYPTANLCCDVANQVVPKNGVYAVRVTVGSLPSPFYGMTNIGTRPTFEGHVQTIETHLFDFSAEIYNERLTIEFVEWLRDEQYFDSVDSLVRQMKFDAEKAKTILFHLKL